MSRPLYPEGRRPWYPFDRRLGGPHSRSGRSGEEKNSQPLPGLKPPIIIIITIIIIIIINVLLWEVAKELWEERLLLRYLMNLSNK
jgi:hypothetical protein